MGKFKAFINTNPVLSESSWSRIIQHVEGDDDFAVISAYRSSNTDDENLKQHAKLKDEVRKLGFGYIEQSSGYTYKDASTGESEVRQERSLFIPKIDYKNAMLLGAKYNQESILLKNKEKGFVLIYTTSGVKDDGTKFKMGDVDIVFKSKKDKDGKITFDPEVLKYAYSSLLHANKSQKGKKYAFVVESICEGIIPTRTNSVARRDNYISWRDILK